MSLQSSLESMLSWLRNGSVLVGDDPEINNFRELCLERAYTIASQDITPALAATSAVIPNQSISNLADVSAMMQKKALKRR